MPLLHWPQKHLDELKSFIEGKYSIDETKVKSVHLATPRIKQKALQGKTTSLYDDSNAF